MGKKKSGTPALAVLASAGVAFIAHEYAFEPDAGAIGLQAAAALGVEPARLLKTLMVEIDGSELVTAIIASDRELDLKALARAAGGKRAAMADLAAAERATGYVKGGISPLGQRRRHRAFLDEAACIHATVIVNGGRRGLQIELGPSDLVQLLDAARAPLARA